MISNRVSLPCSGHDRYEIIRHHDPDSTACNPSLGCRPASSCWRLKQVLVPWSRCWQSTACRLGGGHLIFWAVVFSTTFRVEKTALSASHRLVRSPGLLKDVRWAVLRVNRVFRWDCNLLGSGDLRQGPTRPAGDRQCRRPRSAYRRTAEWAERNAPRDGRTRLVVCRRHRRSWRRSPRGPRACCTLRRKLLRH